MSSKLHDAALKAVAAIAITTIPALLSYCQASKEADAAKVDARREADAGYKALVRSVRHLEDVVKVQGEVITVLVQHGFGPTADWVPPPIPTAHEPDAGAGSGSDDVVRMPALDAAVPQFPDLPESNAAAYKQQMQMP